jgi:4'-phosphopantetheinyl transferase
MSNPASTQVIGLPERTVHLWRLSVAQTRISFDYHLSLLDEEEKFHAARFHFRQDREQSILARASLRLLMARYTGFAPERIRFKKNQYGKLFLQYPESPVQFNVTHSGDCIIHAITREAEIGVDVETVRDSGSLGSISSYFATGEQAWLDATAHEARDDAFFMLWTCKEAYIKALGQGLSKPLDSFEIGIVNNEPKILFDSDAPALAASWQLLLFKPRPNMAGCVAVNTSINAVEFRDYESGLHWHLSDQ